MNIVDAVLFGFVEGITEFLPISSTGHLMLTAKLLGVPQTPFQTSFEVAIQLGAILSVVVLYARSLILNTEILKRVLVAFIPTAIVGFLLHRIIKDVFLTSDTIVLWALLIGGIVLIAFEFLHREKADAHEGIASISYKNAVLIGLFQALAVIPGVSRAGATIIGGLSLGMKRTATVEFSFLLAIPTMLAATGLDLLKTAPTFTPSEFAMLLIGFVISFLVALMAVKWFLQFIKGHTFIGFGVYRILVALVFLMLIS